MSSAREHQGSGRGTRHSRQKEAGRPTGRPPTRHALLLCLAIAAQAAATTPDVVIEAESCAAKTAEVLRDGRASGGQCAALFFAQGDTLLKTTRVLPAGDYVATFWLEAVPVEVLHTLAVRVRAGATHLTLNAFHFNGRPGYEPFAIRGFHPGGPLAIEITGRATSGFDGIRTALSEHEQADLKTVQAESEVASSLFGATSAADDDFSADDALSLLEAERNAAQLTSFDHRLLCDRVEIRQIRPAPVMVSRVDVDKIHYLPGETVQASATLRAEQSKRACTLVAEIVTELDDTREVFARPLEITHEPQTVSFEFALTDREFGHELRCSLVADDKVLHANSALFGVSRNVYRIGITGRPGGQDMRHVSVEQAATTARENKRLYANYFERFAWAPCDYSNLAPDTEIFYSGQTQYPGSITGFRNLIAEAHKVGVKAITYGKTSAGGIEGFKTFQRFPELFQHRPEGPATEAMHTFYLERMLANDYLLHAPPSEGGWQHWASLWTDWSHDRTVIFGAEAIMRSIEMFGWDGVRWDGHFVDRQKPFLDLLKSRYPLFVHGYNIAFANPAADRFLPPAGHEDDFHLVAQDHGLMMDESARDWSHTNWSPGDTLLFYRALCREADYIKRIGGLPLYITFDMASRQDATFNVLCGLSAGQRYTYMNSPADFVYGPLPKFLTRYSAFVWDDTRRIADPGSVITVSAGTPSDAPAPWWQQSVWLREQPSGRQQLLINILNPPGYPKFCNRVQPPPITRHDLVVRVTPPQGARVTKAIHLSPDLANGHEPLDLVAKGDAVTVTLPRFRAWSVVLLELDGGPTPAYALTTPVKDADAVRSQQAAERARQDEEKRSQAGIAPSQVKTPKVQYYKDYANTRNADKTEGAKLEGPDEPQPVRDGILHVHHARGAFSWLHPIEAAVGILGTGSYEPSWVDYVGFRLGAGGCMDDFPDTYAQLQANDVLVLDNIHSFHLGPRRRCMIADFVKNGGGLLVFGGYFNLSLGADHNTALAELLPIRIEQYKDIVRQDAGLPLTAADPAFFADRVRWQGNPAAFTVDVSPLKDDVRVLAKVGDHPAIVARTVGKGRVITVLMNPHGNAPKTVTPYWEWPQWPKLLACCLDWLGEDARLTVAQGTESREIDTTQPTADDLLMSAFDMDAHEFTTKLRAARVNMVDAESSRFLLEAAVDNVDKVEDIDLIADVAERARRHVDRSFVELATKLVASQHDFVRQAGYQILGMTGDPAIVPLLTDGLRREKEKDLLRALLIAVARAGDPAGAKAVRDYASHGTEKLLAASVRCRLGDRVALPDALSLYEQGVRRRLRLKSGRRAAYDTLHGGTSFKLTKTARKQAEAEYRKVQKLEGEAKHDTRFFVDSLTELSAADLDAVADFLAQTELPEVLSMAYTVLNAVPPEQAKPFRQKMAAAALPALRLLAEE